MTQHVLTDAEMHTLISGNPFALGLSIARLKDFIRQVEKAVLAKLHEQQDHTEHVRDMVNPSLSIDTKEDQHYTVRCNDCWWHGNEEGLELAVAADYPDDEPAKVCPNCKKLGCLMDLEGANHIADMRKMVADMYWISDEFSTETILDAFDPIVGMIDVSVGDTFEVKRAKTLPSITVEVTEMTEYGDVKAYKIIGAEHIPDDGKTIGLSLSVDTKEAQALLQSYLDGLDGWQLVPVKPTKEMHLAARDWSVRKYGKAIGLEASYGCYKTMLAAAPKFGDKQ